MLNPKISANKIGSCGLLVPSTMAKVISVEENGTEECLGPNQTGELCIKGPQVTCGM